MTDPPNGFTQVEPATSMPDWYSDLLVSIRDRVSTGRRRAVAAATHELVLTYWQMGREILDRQDREGYGTRVIDRLSTDLKQSFPGATGYSSRNRKYMRAFAAAWPDLEVVQQAVAQRPWSRRVILAAVDPNCSERDAASGAVCLLPRDDDRSSVGLLPGRSKDSVVAECAPAQPRRPDRRRAVGSSDHRLAASGVRCLAAPRRDPRGRALRPDAGPVMKHGGPAWAATPRSPIRYDSNLVARVAILNRSFKYGSCSSSRIAIPNEGR